MTAALGRSPAPTATSFDAVVDGTLCPFARKAALRPLPALEDGEPVAGYLARVAPLVRAWVGTADVDGTDGILTTLPVDRVGADPEALGPVLYALLEAVADPASMHNACLSEAAWRLSIAGEDVFVAVFTPAFGPDHSRHTPVDDKVYVLVQPDSSFHRRLPEDSGRLRETIRQQFADAGRGYEADISEAERYLPSADAGRPVPWWRASDRNGAP